MAFDQATGFHYQFAHSPVHVPLGTFFVEFEKIQRYHQNASGSELMGDTHVGFISISVIGSRENNHSVFIRFRFQFR